MKLTKLSKLFFVSTAAVVSMLASPAKVEAAETWASCNPTQVMVYSVGSKRIHVRCAAAVGGIQYFSLLPGADANAMSRTLAVLSTAQVAGRTLSVLYDPAEAPTAGSGCGSADCRLIHAVGFGN